MKNFTTEKTKNIVFCFNAFPGIKVSDTDFEHLFQDNNFKTHFICSPDYDLLERRNEFATSNRMLIQCYNYHFMCWKSFDFFESDSFNYYVGGITYVPFLFIYGDLFKKLNLNFIDKCHKDKKYFVLNDKKEKSNSLITQGLNEIDYEKNIGLAVGLSFEIQGNQLPKEVQSNTVFIKPQDLQFKQNYFTSQKSLNESADFIIKTLDGLISNLKNNKASVHLFLSIPIPLAIILGQKFNKENYGKIYLYNFSNGKYNFRFQFTGHSIYKYEVLNEKDKWETDFTYKTIYEK